MFNVNQSFFILFMVIIGGLGSLIGSFFGAALIFILPIVLRYRSAQARHSDPRGDRRAHPVHDHRRADRDLSDRRAAGLARLWQIGKQKLRVWPFPY